MIRRYRITIIDLCTNAIQSLPLNADKEHCEETFKVLCRLLNSIDYRVILETVDYTTGRLKSLDNDIEINKVVDNE